MAKYATSTRPEALKVIKEIQVRGALCLLSACASVTHLLIVVISCSR